MKFCSVAPMKTAKIGYIIISVMLSLTGIALIVFPKISAAAIGEICSILLICFGCVRIVGYLSKDLYSLAFQYDLKFGILFIILGVVLLANPRNLMDFICIVFGIIILSDGLFKIQIAFDSKKFGIGKWWMIFGLAVLSGICGAALMFRPGEGSNALMILLGIALSLEGIVNLSTVITAVKIVKHQKPDSFDTDFCEESEEK